jgi:hypothetical protein
MTGASTALRTAAASALRSISSLAIYEGPPLQAATPYAVVEAGAETDWGHKSGSGRELRLAVTIHDRGERPALLDGMIEEAEAVLASLGGNVGGWRLVTFRFVRSRMAPPPAGSPNGLWSVLLDYRARMLAD